MALTEAQKNAQKRYYEKNRERLLAYKSKYWQANKHKWNRGKTETETEGGQRPPGSSAASPVATATTAMN
jgi:hypothetical protein